MGLTVSINKKGLLTSTHLVSGDIQPLHTGSGPIEMVKDFTYLGSKFSADCKIRDEEGTSLVNLPRPLDAFTKRLTHTHTSSLHLVLMDVGQDLFVTN